ncbi:hypothetical protein BaRGS_00014833 [Batillaria attramentaria]|uniref:Nuclear protein MDM1 n=1 Tax=Batillaria attramentaria TaxID=370345 RepID=A0ABD0L3V4_9CAEN
MYNVCLEVIVIVLNFLLGLSYEPPLQHKRRVNGPSTSWSFNYNDPGPASDDYAILGQQEKFAPNVRYKPKAVMKGKPAKWENDIAASKIAAAKDISPAKQRRVDEKQEGKNEFSKALREKTPTTPPPAPRTVKDASEAGLKEGLRDKNLSDVLRKGGSTVKLQPAKASESKQRANMNEFVQTDMEKGLALSGQEASADYSLKYKAGVAPARLNKKASEYQKQFDWKKGIPASPLLTAEQSQFTDSALPPNSATGSDANSSLAEPKPTYTRHVSGDFFKLYPWLVLRNDSEAVKRSKSVGASRSPDRLAPAGSQPVTRPEDPRLLQESKEKIAKPVPPVEYGKLKYSENISGCVLRFSAVVALLLPVLLPASSVFYGLYCTARVFPYQRGRSAAILGRALAAGARVPGGNRDWSTGGDGARKRSVTEYRANFASPTRYSYDEGAWKGAYPPQLLHSQKDNIPKSTSPQAEAEEAVPLSNWFAEVLELRRRANEYKRRAQGTHFSREHLAQLLAQQAGYWDIDSARSAATLDALALEPGPAVKAQQRRRIGKKVGDDTGVDAVSHVAVQGDSPDPSDIATPTRGREKQRRPKPSKKGYNFHKTAWGEAQKENQSPQEPKGNAAEEEEACEDQQETVGVQCPEDTREGSVSERIEGRLSTPVLRQQNQNVARHHLDLTTPSVGGVLLSSADQKKVLTSRSGDSCLTILDEHESPKPNCSATKLLTSPLLGKPTPDTHPLRDEEASTDYVMDTEYVASPVLPSSPPVKKRTASSRPKKSRRVKQSELSTVDERMGQTYNKASEPDFRLGDLPDVSRVADDDVLSVSAMSIASSSSLASEVYERARRRRDEFWGEQNNRPRN